jgi:hypothetical protein
MIKILRRTREGKIQIQRTTLENTYDRKKRRAPQITEGEVDNRYAEG